MRFLADGPPDTSVKVMIPSTKTYRDFQQLRDHVECLLKAHDDKSKGRSRRGETGSMHQLRHAAAKWQLTKTGRSGEQATNA